LGQKAGAIVQISSFEQLNQVGSNLHDCPFDLDRAVFDATTEIWRGIFLRPLWDDPRAKHRGLSLLYLQSQLPVVEATLAIEGVRNHSIVDDQGIGRYTFNELEHITDGVRLAFNEALYINLHLDGGVSATYDEQPLLGVCAIYKQLFLVQSGPKIKRVSEAEDGYQLAKRNDRVKRFTLHTHLNPEPR
jgi:hypothetical protein